MHDPRIRLFRWVVFLLAAGYVLYQVVIDADYTAPGGPFRFLTIWALLASFFCASRMLALTERRSARRWDAVVATTMVMNALVVFLYWRLYFTDPALVNGRGPIPWYLQYYLHALGPLLQWIDALFLHRAVQRAHVAALLLAGVIAGYVLWVEHVVQPLNQHPVGRVTEGLPYPFLNNLEFPERLAFYGTTAATAFGLLAALTILTWAVRRWI